MATVLTITGLTIMLWFLFTDVGYTENTPLRVYVSHAGLLFLSCVLQSAGYGLVHGRGGGVIMVVIVAAVTFLPAGVVCVRFVCPAWSRQRVSG